MSDPVIDRTMAVRIATQLGWEPKREWQGLTYEEQETLVQLSHSIRDAINRTDWKLKEKNSE